MPERVIPVLRVSDAQRSVQWYQRLGFEKRSEHRFEPDMPAYVGIARGDAEIHLSEHEGDARPNTLLYIWVDNVDALAAAVDAEARQQPWARDFEIEDPDGNRLRIAGIGTRAIERRRPGKGGG